MRRACLVGVMLTAACGRIGFDVGGDAGDGSVPDGDAPDDGAALACPAFALFCEDFESGLASWPLRSLVPGARVDLTGAPVHRGTSALEAEIPAIMSGSAAAIVRTVTLPASGVLSARLWVRPVIALEEFDEVLTWRNGTQLHYVSMGGDSAGNWSFTEDSPTGGIEDHLSLVPATVGTWACVELVLDLGSPSRARLYVDDVLAIDELLSDPAPMYTRLHVGLSRVDALGGHAVLDDLVVATQRIGCQ